MAWAYDPYREEARRMLAMLAVVAGVIAGFALYLFVGPHLGALVSLVVAVTGGLVLEVLLLVLLKPLRAKASARE